MTHILIINAPYYRHICDELLAGVEDCLRTESDNRFRINPSDEKSKIKHETVEVPGVLEIPAALEMAIRGEIVYDGFIALGCVIRGETSHYETVAFESARALMDLSVRHALALANGILTVENEKQAQKRANRKELNKGGAAAATVLRMIEVRNRFNGG